MPTTVVNIADAGLPVNKAKWNSSYLYIGRPSIFGNPFRVRGEHTRDEAITRFANWFLDRIKAMGLQEAQKLQLELKDKILVCHCKPKACHGDVLVAFAEAELTEDESSTDSKSSLTLPSTKPRRVNILMATATIAAIAASGGHPHGR